MSTLTGHAKITSQAVRELAQEWKSNPLATGMGSAALPGAAVARDIMDVLNQGHWADFGQKHHFMRQFDSQSPFEAYESACEWIRSNSLEGAKRVAGIVAYYYPQGINKARNPQRAGQAVYRATDWQSLGNACHCLEDSFAKGHATRGPGSPGNITHIKRYAGAEKEGHEHGDEEWKGNIGGFSADGRLAIEAVKALLKMVITTAQGSTNPTALDGWQAFRDKWIKADATLSKAKDRVFELINKYATSLRRGAWNIKTINMNEDGLAQALLNESPQTVVDVFKKLDDQYNSDSDDVALIYVTLIKRAGGAKVAALKSNRNLISVLIKVMDEGWTSSEEGDAIKFLKGL